MTGINSINRLKGLVTSSSLQGTVLFVDSEFITVSTQEGVLRFPNTQDARVGDSIIVKNGALVIKRGAAPEVYRL